MLKLLRKIWAWIKRLFAKQESIPQIPLSSMMRDGGDTPFIHEQAVAYYQACPTDRPDNSPNTFTMTADRWAAMVRVQREINMVPYQPESVDIWGQGQDCDDYAIQKRRALIYAAGCPRNALRLATCKTEDGNYHVVLIAFTDIGCYVFDNRCIDPVAWTQVPYTEWWCERADGSWMIVTK